MRILRSLISAALLLGLAGCATWTPGGKPHVHRAGYTLTVPPGWTYHPSAGGELLATRDGLILQRLTVRGIRLPHTLAGSKRELTAALTPYELVEIFADEGASDRKLSRFTVTARSAARIGGLDGARYDYAFATEDGLRLSGRRWLVPRGDTLWVATYLASSRHYHERDLEAVTAAIEAVTFAPRPAR
jgi:hypothetical protein